VAPPASVFEAEHGWLAAILDSSQDAIIAWSLDWKLTGWSDAAQRLLGYTREQALELPVTALWPSSVSNTLESVVAGLFRDQEFARFETEYRRQDATTVEVSATMTAIRDGDGRVTGVTSIVRDISQRKLSERRLAEERTRWVAAFHSAPIGMALVDIDGQWLEVNRAMCRLLERDRVALMATELRTLTHPDDLDGDGDQLAQVMAGELEGFETERRYRLPSGRFVWTLLSLALVRGLADEPLYFVLQFQDISARKEADAELTRYAAQLAELARRDAVTGLPNYREFQSQLEYELKRAARYEQEWSLVLFDIDGFRQLNEVDRLRGDRALALTGQAIAEACRASDRAARIGADEFALILPNTGADEAQGAAARITSAVMNAGLASLSFGIVTWPHDGKTSEQLLLQANVKLQEAKPPAPPAAPRAVLSAQACPTDVIQELVTVANQFLEMDVAYLARIEDGRQTFRTVAGDAGSFGFGVGDVLDLDATFCKRLLDGRIPNAVPVVADEAELAALPIAREADIGAYLGVPVTLGNGHTYGTLCAISHEPAPQLSTTNLGVMHSFADLIASHVEHDVIEATVRRSGAELTGINALLSALTARDHYTGEHSETVVQLASAVARHIGLAADQVREVEQVALLHDIGKVGIPDSILQKRGTLNDAEWEVMRQHPTIGARILAGIPMFAHLAPAVNAEHERFDGSGYPDGLRGSAIPLASRITFVCDAYHAITSDRPYRHALDPTDARRELRDGAGTQFDPQIITALFELLDGRVDGDLHDHRDGDPVRDALDLGGSRQTPTWELGSHAETTRLLGHARAVCQACGAHSPIVVTRASVGGSCTNCGSYDLRPIDD
jgi:diguanylate cyclase (GGDEF)-like protein/PAS domain S-box-containing protein